MSALTLLTRLVVDPQSGWDADTRDSALRHALGWIVRKQIRNDDTYKPILQTLFGEEFSTHRLSLLAEVITAYRTTTLSLSGTKVVNLVSLAALTGLLRLDLSGTRVTDVTPLVALTGLSWLDLSGTEVTDITPLATLTGLLRLEVRGCRHLSDEQIRKLKVELPKCAIVTD